MTKKEKKALDRFIEKAVNGIPKACAKYGTPATKDIVERALKGSVLKNRPEYLQYVLDNFPFGKVI